MATLFVNRTTPVSDILSFMGASKLLLDVDVERRCGTIAPIIDNEEDAVWDVAANELFGVFNDGKLSSRDFIKQKTIEKAMEN